MPLWPSAWRSGIRSEIDLAADDLDHVAAHPDVIAVLAQIDAAGAPQRRALRRDIGGLGESRTDQPLRHAGVEAAGHRVLVITAADECAQLERGVVPRLVRTDHPQLERRE